MNFIHPLFEKPACINEGEILTLVIENPIALRNTVNCFKNDNTELAVFDGIKTFEFDKCTEFIDNVFDMDFASKRVINKLSNEAERIAGDFQNETISIFDSINKYADTISASFDLPIKFSFLDETDRLMKFLNFHIDTEDMTLPELLLSYMEVCRKIFEKKLFAVLNFKEFISDEEFKLFCKNVSYEKFYVLLIEAYDYKRSSENEKKIIIDNDLCVIYNSDEKYLT